MPDRDRASCANALAGDAIVTEATQSARDRLPHYRSAASIAARTGS